MPIAAAPKYLGNNFDDASCALRFGMYLKLWGIDSKSKETLWKTHDQNYCRTGRDRQERLSRDSNKTSALKGAAPLNESDRKLMDEFVERQKKLFQTIPEKVGLQLFTESVAPFTTGLGNEHPLENGFAFLNPYGLPYLPGSGVKGVVRRAAEELAGIAPGVGWEDASDWTEQDIDDLFGLASDKGAIDACRGALSFWDVMPQVKGSKLMVEIMNPHYSHYYQPKLTDRESSASPHDSGQPVPITFLTVPPGSAFTFYVVCDSKRLSPDLAENGHWQKLLTSAFEHAFDWCGFGAKTAVGYGAMERDTKAEEEQKRKVEQQKKKEAEERERQERMAAMDPIEREIQETLDNRTDENVPEVTEIIKAMEAGRWRGEQKIKVAQWLKNKMSKEKRWRESGSTNKKNNKDYQRTLRVIAWLEGK